MDGQDEGSRRIYNQRDLTKRETIRKTPESSSCIVSEEEKKNSSSDEARGQTFTPTLCHWRSCSLTILPDRWRSPRKGPVLEPASLSNSLYWACWVWVRSHLHWRTPQINTLQLVYVFGIWINMNLSMSFHNPYLLSFLNSNNVSTKSRRWKWN